MRARLAWMAIAASLATVGLGQAEPIAVPLQADWAAAKKTVDLPNGETLAYVEMGDPAGAPALLIHGYTDNSRSWSLIAPYLKHRRLLAIDLRGHGKSEAPDCCYAYTDMVQDAALFLDAMAIARADVIGHSLGSMVAQLLAAQHPDKVGRIVLVSSTTEIAGGPGSWLWDNITPLKAPIDPESQFMKDWYWNPNPVDQDFITRERTESAATPIHVWKGVLWGAAIGDLAPIAPLVKAPVLVLWGDQDSLFDLTHQEKLEKAYPEARFEVFRGAGHNMFWEFPDDAAAIIEGFLNEPAAVAAPDPGKQPAPPESPSAPAPTSPGRESGSGVQ